MSPCLARIRSFTTLSGKPDDDLNWDDNVPYGIAWGYLDHCNDRVLPEEVIPNT